MPVLFWVLELKQGIKEITPALTDLIFGWRWEIDRE